MSALPHLAFSIETDVELAFLGKIKTGYSACGDWKSLYFAGRYERLDDFIHAWLNRGYGERRLEKRKRGRVLTHGLIVFDASPLCIHRDLCPVETSMATRRNKARREAYGDLCCVGNERNQLLLIGGINSEDIDERHDAAFYLSTATLGYRWPVQKRAFF